MTLGLGKNIAIPDKPRYIVMMMNLKQFRKTGTADVCLRLFEISNSRPFNLPEDDIALSKNG